MRPQKEQPSNNLEGVARELFVQAQNGPLYDEVGSTTSEFGWYGLLMHKSAPYIISYRLGSFTYTKYKSERSAKKTWDYICNKYEDWYKNSHE